MEVAMKRSRVILLMILLIVHSFMGPLAVSANVDHALASVNESQNASDETSKEATNETKDAESPGSKEDNSTNEPKDTEKPDSNKDNSANEGKDAEVPGSKEDSNVVPDGSNPEEPKTVEETVQQELALPVANTEITENILTDAELTFEDKNGNEAGSVDRETIIAVKYKWALKNNHGYTAGATYKFNLPKELVVYEAITNEPLLFNGEAIGTFSVDMNGLVTVVFNDFIEKRSNISGTMEVLSKISEKVVVTEDKIVKVIPIVGGVSKDIPITFHPNGSTIDKQGIPNKSYNTESIEWTVNFNKSLDPIKNAVLKDPIPDGLELQEGSIKVYKLITKLDGTVEQGNEVTSGFTIGKTDGKDFEINFGDISTAYRVVYTTKVIDQDKTEFVNKAFLSGDGFTDKEASASVGVKRGVALEKKSANYDPATQTITWEIKYNYNEKSIVQANALLKDFFNNTQELVGSSFVVEKVKIDENGNESGPGEVFTNYTVTPKSEGNKNGFWLQFNQDINEAYKITYQTKAKDRIFDSEKITNEVEAGDKQATGTKEIYQQILYKSNYKDKTDYKEKTTTWGISFNVDSHLMKNVKLTDTFPNKGLVLISDTLKISNTKRILKIDEDYRLVNKGENGFEIEFLHEINDRHYIEYKTTFNYEARTDKTKNYLENEAVITWIDENGEEKTKKSTATFTPDSYTQSNGFKNGKYNAVAKEITWNIGINYNLKTLEKASVEDEILGNQVIDRKSLKVFKMTLTGGENGTKREEAIENSDYKIDWEPNGKPGFKVSFLNEIKSAYLIEYKTSLNDQLIKDKYDNTATLKDGEDKVTDLSASVSVPHGGKYTGKSGEQNGKIIDWKVEINFGQSKVSNAKVVDKPSENQSLLEQSFHLYATSVAENGKVTKGTELEQGVDYTLEFNNDGFELVFKKDIDKPYILEYQSLILAKVGDKVNNDIKFTGDQITTETTKSTSTIIVKRTTGSGTGSGEVGKLEVIKVDAKAGENGNKKKLEGATFSLIDSESKAVIKTAITDAEGKVTFDRLLYGEYLLKEDKAPEGYVVGINDTKTVEINKADNTVEIANEKIKQAVELIKFGDDKDKDGKAFKLKGAEFELQRKEGSDFVKVGTHTTDEDGKIVVADLKAGEYRFIETKAPEHYLLDNTPVEFTIVDNQTSIVKVEKENKRGKGNLTVVKVDAANQKVVLKGAVFKLYNSKEEEVATKTTGADGKATFENLSYDQYTLKEVTAPKGYAIDKTEGNLTVKIDKEKNDVTIKNNKIIRAFKLKKVDTNNPHIGLKDAVFKLMYKKLKTDEYALVEGKDKLTTDGNGVIYEENLSEGYYQLIEVKAPSGYVLDSKPIEFIIEKEQIKVLDLTKTNNPNSPGGSGGSGGGGRDKSRDPEPGKPNDPATPNNPDKPNNPGDPNNPDEPNYSGEPNNPGEPNHSEGSNTPDESNHPRVPNIPGDLVSVNNPNTARNPDTDETSLLEPRNVLPQTGEQARMGTQFAGIALILIGIGIMVYRRKAKA
jgi:LPXTG-motif cell wall-anchored protein